MIVLIKMDKTDIQTKRAYACRSGCGAPARDHCACCSDACRKKITNCRVEGCSNAPEPITYQGQDYAGYTRECYKHGGRQIYEDTIIEQPAQKVMFVYTVKGWLQTSREINFTTSNN